MGLMDLVVGPFRPALEGAFKETFARIRGDDPLAPLAVIAPSKRIADRLKELALDAVPEGFAAVRFFNLFSFARTIYEEDAAKGFTLLLDDLVPQRLLRAILRLHFAREPYLSRALNAPPSALLGVLHELKAGAVVPDLALKFLVEEDLGVEETPKLAEIFSLYKRYSEELRRRRLHERSDVVRLAAECAPKSAVVAGFRHVLYYGFYDLDQNQLDLLREVQRRVPCTVFFPYLDTSGYAFARPFLQEIIAPMASRVMRLPEPPPPARVAQISTSGAHDEVWAAAKEILRFVDRGFDFADVGVVARTLDPYLDPIDSLFREHRIPYTSSATRPLARDPAIKAARLLFTIDDFDRAHVLDLLRSPYMKDRRGDRALWDPASRLMGIGTGADEWRRRVGAGPCPPLPRARPARRGRHRPARDAGRLRARRPARGAARDLRRPVGTRGRKDRRPRPRRHGRARQFVSRPPRARHERAILPALHPAGRVPERPRPQPAGRAPGLPHPQEARRLRRGAPALHPARVVRRRDGVHLPALGREGAAADLVAVPAEARGGLRQDRAAPVAAPRPGGVRDPDPARGVAAHGPGGGAGARAGLGRADARQRDGVPRLGRAAREADAL